MNPKIFLLVASAVLFTCAIASAQVEEITLSTYYPAPYGEYEEMAAEKFFADKVIIGNMDVDGDGDFSDIDDINAMNVGSLLVENNVGIGTTSPSYKLEVSGISAFSDRLYKTVVSPGGSDPTLIGAETEWAQGEIPIITLGFEQGATSGTDMDTKIRSYARTPSESQNFITIGRSRIDISGKTYFDGNVGIGTTSPVSSLHVKSGGGTTAPGFFSDSGNWGIKIGPGTFMQAVEYRPAFGDFLTKSLILQFSGGNVGIGTTSPGSKLEVNGTMKVSGAAFTPQTVLIPGVERDVSTTSTSFILVDHLPRAFFPWAFYKNTYGVTKLYIKLIGWLINTSGNTVTMAVRYQRNDTTGLDLVSISRTAASWAKVESGWIDVWSVVGVEEDLAHFYSGLYVSGGTGYCAGPTIVLRME